MKIKKYNEFEFLTEEVKLSKVVKTITIDGFTIYVGRNAESNDILTTEIAKPNDLWFHSANVAGSHVVIVVDDKTPPKHVIKKAAELAAENSKGEGKIRVIYTEARNVTKTNKNKIGQVQVEYDKSNFIEVNKL